MKIILPECSSLCQPCDLYFYRQVENYIGQFQNWSVLAAANYEVSSREDCIKIHLLIHNQLQAPIYSIIMKYAWYARKLIMSHEAFSAGNQIAFLDAINIAECECSEQAFMWWS